MTTVAPVPEVNLALQEGEREILTPEAVEFLRSLHGRFESARVALLERRRARQEHFDRGGFPAFFPDTEPIRNEDCRVAPIPDELLDRRVKIAGPTERKMVINALNSGTNVFMADFEDAS